MVRKHIVILFLLALLVSLFGCTADSAPSGTAEGTEKPDRSRWHVALVSDYGTVSDGGFKQDVFEAAEAWCRENGVAFSVYEPAGDSTAERVEMIDQAVLEGANVLLLPGYSFADAIVETVEKYPDVYYFATGVTEYDLNSAKGIFDGGTCDCPANLYCANYREEISGYLAGWAAVAGGYSKLGALCGFPISANLRLCYGFMQGAEAAAAALGRTAEVEVRYALFGTFTIDEERVRSTLGSWYDAGTELFFTVGDPGFLDFAAKELAADGKQIAMAEGLFRPDLDEAVTEAVVLNVLTDCGVEVRRVLTDLIVNEEWSDCGGTIARIGITSEDPAQNGIGLAEPFRMGDGFTGADYAALIGALYRGELTVSDETDREPKLGITVIEDIAAP